MTQMHLKPADCLNGRVVDYSQNSYVISTEEGSFRIYFTNYQIFLRDLGLALKAAPSDFKPAGFSESEIAKARVYSAMVPYQKVTVKLFQSESNNRSPPVTPVILPACAGEIVTESERLKSEYGLFDFLARLNGLIHQRLFAALEPGAAGIAFGMVSGITAYIPDGMSEAFSRTGTFHLLAVSGLHVGLVYLVIKKILHILKIKCALNSLFSTIGSFLYVCLSGFQVSAVRALIMIAVYEVSKIFLLGLNLKDVLHLVFLLFVLLSPADIFTVSFQLSFSCMLAIAYVFERVRRLLAFPYLPGRLIDYLALTLSINLTLVPLNLLYFGRVPFLGMVANVFAVPLALPLLTGTLLLVAIPNIAFIAVFLRVLISLLVNIVRFFALLPLASLSATGLLMVLLATFSALVTYRKYLVKSFRPFMAAAYLAAAIWWLAPCFICFDVGEGGSCLVKSGLSRYVLDTGPPRSSVAAKLLAKGTASIDELIISHFHLDHAGNLLNMAYDPVLVIKEICYPPVSDEREKTIIQLVSFLRPQARQQPIGDRKSFQFFKTHIDVIKPTSTVREAEEEGNEDCLAVVIRFNALRGTKSILYPADIPAETLSQLWTRNVFDVIIAPHHGSIDGFSPSLYRPPPEKVIISCGKNNYGHPSKVLIDFLRGEGIDFVVTQQHGDVEYFP